MLFCFFFIWYSNKCFIRDIGLDHIRKIAVMGWDLSQVIQNISLILSSKAGFIIIPPQGVMFIYLYLPIAHFNVNCFLNRKESLN